MLHIFPGDRPSNPAAVKLEIDRALEQKQSGAARTTLRVTRDEERSIARELLVRVGPLVAFIAFLVVYSMWVG